MYFYIIIIYWLIKFKIYNILIIKIFNTLILQLNLHNYTLHNYTPSLIAPFSLIQAWGFNINCTLPIFTVYTIQLFFKTII